METIEISLTLEDIELLFKILGNRPFNEVYELIGKINEQVVQQTSENATTSISTEGT